MNEQSKWLFETPPTFNATPTTSPHSNTEFFNSKWKTEWELHGGNHNDSLLREGEGRQTLNQVLLEARDYNHRIIAGCRFQVWINNQPVAVNLAGDRALVNLPPQPRPLRFSIRVVPPTTDFWQLEGIFEFRARGRPIVINASPAGFHPPSVQNFQGRPVGSIVAVLSRLRIANQQVINFLNCKPLKRGGNSKCPPEQTPWIRSLFLPIRSQRFVAFPPVTQDGTLNHEMGPGNVPNTNIVFEVAGVDAPKLITVSWPGLLERNARSAPTPFLIYFRPYISQNIENQYGGGWNPNQIVDKKRNIRKGPGFYINPDLCPKPFSPSTCYPFGWDFLFHGIWAFLNYDRPVLPLGNGFKGLPYQIDQARKKVVLVMPLNAFPPTKQGEFGEFMKAPFVEEILQDIQAVMFRLAGIFNPPSIGRVAIGAFSVGNDATLNFLSHPQNQSHQFYQETLRELYLFGKWSGGSQSIAAWLNQAEKWAMAGSPTSAADKRIRVYTEGEVGEKPLYRRFLGRELPVTTAFVVDSPDFHRTAGILPFEVWQKAFPRGPIDTHQLISAMMLTDAMRRSGF